MNINNMLALCFKQISYRSIHKVALKVFLIFNQAYHSVVGLCGQIYYCQQFLATLNVSLKDDLPNNTLKVIIDPHTNCISQLFLRGANKRRVLCNFQGKFLQCCERCVTNMIAECSSLEILTYSQHVHVHFTMKYFGCEIIFFSFFNMLYK